MMTPLTDLLFEVMFSEVAIVGGNVSQELFDLVLEDGEMEAYAISRGF